jgi:hypothetical protein
MKFPFILVFSICAFISNAQQAVQFYQNRPAHSFYFSREECNASDNNSLETYMEKRLGCSLVFKQRRANSFGSTASFAQIQSGAMVYQGFVKVIMNDKDNSFLVFYDVFTDLPSAPSNQSQCWVFNDGWVLATRSIEPEYSTGSLFETLKDKSGNIILKHDLAMHSGPVDTLIRVNVFNTDPLTSSHRTYGNGYVDSNDSDLATLNAERTWKNVRCNYNNDTFFISNKYLEAHKYNAGFAKDPVYRIHDTVFDYTRHQPAFEDVMILYHITSYQEYLQSIGVLAGYLPLPFDAHGNNTDNSSFIPSAGSGFWGVQFGTGGIDDAEDAEVIVHEYTHSLREFCAPGTAVGLERMSVEEGTCDYMATSYKMAIDTFGWRKFAYWDGNNPPLWSGRDVASAKIYPGALTGDFYKNGEIWSSALMRLYFKFGKTMVDQLVMQTMNYYAQNQSMPQCAWLVIKSDSVLFNGAHALDIQRVFAETHILPWPTGVEAKSKISPAEIRNSYNFMQGNGNLKVVLPYKTSAIITVTNILGEVLLEKELEGNYTELSRNDIHGTGLCILTITTPDGTGSYKLYLR